MHPPLDRPHPDCQAEIEGLRDCQDTKPVWKYWACNEIKWKLDCCFKAEKERMLKKMNADVSSRRAEEEAQAALSTGKNMTFHQYLATDKAYQKDLDEIRTNGNATSSWFG